MNKKGFVLMQGILVTVAVGMLIATVALTPRHRYKKAVNLCMDQGNTIDYCKDYVDNLSKDDLLDYIRDK